MKKASINNLDKLKNEGWSIEPADQPKIAMARQLLKSEGLLVSINDAIEAMRMAVSGQSDALDKILIAQGERSAKIFRECTDQITEAIVRPKQFSLDIVKRNDKGFIQRVVIKET